MTKGNDVAGSFEAAIEAAGRETYVLRLYVAGGTPLSIQALVNLKALCASRLKGRHTLEVIDVYQEPDRARAEQIVAVPTLVKASPLPSRRLIGDLSDTARVLRGLNLPPLPEDDGAQAATRRRR